MGVDAVGQVEEHDVGQRALCVAGGHDGLVPPPRHGHARAQAGRVHARQFDGREDGRADDGHRSGGRERGGGPERELHVHLFPDLGAQPVEHLMADEDLVVVLGCPPLGDGGPQLSGDRVGGEGGGGHVPAQHDDGEVGACHPPDVGVARDHRPQGLRVDIAVGVAGREVPPHAVARRPARQAVERPHEGEPGDHEGEGGGRHGHRRPEPAPVVG
ncbi:MAG: hypothetical protein ACRD2W_14045, partial [Acidimicrobiales bacterium]